MANPLSVIGGLLAALVLPASAAVTIDFVTVGNAGNPADATGYGAVGYEYRIARNETTIGQYTEFLNAVAKSDPYGLYTGFMATIGRIAGIARTGTVGSYVYSVIGTSSNRPITYVSWFDAARFCNWLHNGQGNGSTETGAYNLNGATYYEIITAQPDAKFWIPTENEWYKAAYYDPTKGGSGGYWLFPTRVDTAAGNTIGVVGAANYFDGDYVGSGSLTVPTANALTDVGAYGGNSDSYYGTNDQGGNVHEWTDAVVNTNTRARRGGSWGDSQNAMRTTYRNWDFPNSQFDSIGFRIATVPEPATLVLVVFAGILPILRRRR